MAKIINKSNLEQFFLNAIDLKPLKKLQRKMGLGFDTVNIDYIV